MAYKIKKLADGKVALLSLAGAIERYIPSNAIAQIPAYPASNISFQINGIEVDSIAALEITKLIKAEIETNAPTEIKLLRDELNSFFLNEVSSCGLITKDWLFKNEFSNWNNGGVLNGFNAAASTVAINTAIATLNIVIPTGFIGRIYSLSFFAESGCRFTGFISTGNHASNMENLSIPIDVMIPPAGGTFLLTFGPEGIELNELGRVNLTVYARTVTHPQPSIVPFAKIIVADANYSANKIIETIGDGIANFGTLSTLSVINYGNTHFLGRIATALNSLGFAVRKRTCAFNAATSSEIVTMIKSGRLNSWTAPHLLILNFGINSAAIAAAGAAFQADYEFVLDYFFTKNPSISIICNGPTATDKAANATYVASYRTMISAIVSGSANANKYALKVASKQLKYYDASTGLIINDTNFTETGAGNRFYPRGDTGHEIIYNGLWPVVQATKFYLG